MYKMPKNPDIKYINKDFDSLKSDLIEYAKTYYPKNYNDFSQASPGSMFIEMASFVGDILSFYLDNQIQETFTQYAKQKSNLYALAYMMGYRPKVTSAALVKLDVYQQVDAVGLLTKSPDFSQALIIKEGMTVKSNANNSISFYIPSKIDFSMSSSYDPTEVSVYDYDTSGAPKSFLLKKSVDAISGEIKTKQFSFSALKRYPTIELSDTNIISVVSIIDQSGSWYEVPYLAQDEIDNPVKNLGSNQDQVPYFLEKVKVPKRFTTRFKTNDSLVIEFGPGINSVADSAIIPNPSTVGLGSTTGSNTINTAFDPTNFITTETYGLAPKNTTLTVSYLTGGGSKYNVLSNELIIHSSVTVVGPSTSKVGTLVLNNPEAATGGGDGDTIEELRQNIMKYFASQKRAVTQEDYLALASSMPSKYGKVYKSYITKDDATFANYLNNDQSNKDLASISLYVLSLNSKGQLALPSAELMKNLQNYLIDYRMLTDVVNIKPAYIINLGVNFDIITKPYYNSQDVIARCIEALKQFFTISNWQINEPIVITDLYTILDTIDGVQTVKNIEIINKSGESEGYSKFSYDISSATLNNIIHPSLDPSIFEIKYPDLDIKGRVVQM